MHTKGFSGVETIAVGEGASALRESIRQQQSGLGDGNNSSFLAEEDFEPRTLAGELQEDTADKLVFTGLSSSNGLLAVFDLASKKTVIETFPHIPPSASVPEDRRGGAIHAIAYDPESHLLASASAKGVVVVRDLSTMSADGESKSMRIFSRNQAIINDLAFVKTTSGVDLIVTPASGLPFRVSMLESDSVKVVEEYAGWEAVPVNSVAVGAGEGNIWVAGGEGGIRQY
jgi:proteasomal ATPase-associated factor 1